MANAEHLEKLTRGPQTWNAYVESQMPGFRTDLAEANLIGANLTKADLEQSKLCKAVEVQI